VIGNLSDIKKINDFFRTAIRKDIENIENELLFTEIQAKIFRMFYINRKDIGFISDELGFSRDAVDKQLKYIRMKILKIL